MLLQVVEQLQSVMEFWLNEGVDGFNIDSVNLLVENFADKTGDMDKSMVSWLYLLVGEDCFDQYFLSGVLLA